jgi:hypothetical protein
MEMEDIHLPLTGYAILPPEAERETPWKVHYALIAAA